MYTEFHCELFTEVNTWRMKICIHLAHSNDSYLPKFIERVFYIKDILFGPISTFSMQIINEKH